MKFVQIILVLSILLGANLAFAQSSDCPYEAPATLTNTIHTPTYIAYDFSAVQGAPGYEVKIIYTNGNPTQMMVLDANATSFSAYVLPGEKTIQVRVWCDDEHTSPNHIEHTLYPNIIIVDLIGGYQQAPPPATEIHCQHSSISSYVPPVTCDMIPETGALEYYFTFKADGIPIYGALKNELNTTGRLVKVYNYIQNPISWNFNDQGGFNPTYVRAYSGSSHNPSVSLTISVSESDGIFLFNIVRGGTNQTTAITDFKIYTNNPEGPAGDPKGGSGDERGNNDMAAGVNYAVSPNPFNDYLNITLDTPENSGDITIQLFNVTGGLQKTVTLSSSEMIDQNYTIPTSDLQSGMYIMHINTADGIQQVSKVFKL